MSIRVSVIISVTAGLILVSLPLFAKPTPKQAEAKTATIENSGSTNTRGYQIVVSSRGMMSYSEAGAKPRMLHAAKDTTAKLFADLAAAMPLTALPVRHGMRSVSFGTQTFITYQGQRSPDLTTPSGPLAAALHDDIKVVEGALHAANHPRFPLVRTVPH